MDTLTAIENTGFGIWVRESGSVWSYPTIIFLHSLGLAFLVGMNAVLAFRLLGLAPRVPLAALERLYPIMWAGFWVNAASGVALSIADAATMFVSGLFYLKLGLIAAAVVNMACIKRYVFAHPRGDVATVTTPARFMATLSLVLWAGAITAGRLTAYIGPAVALKGR
jgi:hypothetical protein